MKYILILLLLASCCPQKHVPKIAKTDTTTGHWEFYDGEDMRWVPDVKNNHQ